jgi:sugar/nucleoside kinase (ribokinase family)
MNGRAEIARRAADGLARAAGGGLPPVLVGFDGFIDAIARVVDLRRDMTPGGFEPIRTIPQFAARVSAAAGKSANIEIVVEEERFGGNGPLMAGALGRLGAGVTYIGAVGREDDPRTLHPLYAEFAARCRRVIPVAPPAHTDALEFDDGKIMLGRPANVQAVTWDRLKDIVGLDEILSLVGASRLLGIVNWTLAGGTEGIWRGLVEEVLPRLASRPLVFVDLSDPAKRTDGDLRRAMDVLSRMNALTGVTLGLNLAESERVGRVMGCPTCGADPAETLTRAAGAIRAAIGVECVVIHPREGAATATAARAAWFEGPLCARPRLSTGAGDHFNAGFALARTAGLGLDECLAVGCAESGAFVRDGVSPDLPRLLGFLRDLPGPEPGAG